ncbi:MAG: hypothetical protein WC308_02070 [archaeon]|jgi:hypothetical protein
MKAYVVFAFLLLGFFFIYTGIDFLGLLFLVLSLVSLLYLLIKSKAKSAWEEVKAADGSYPSGSAINDYTKNVAGLFADKVMDIKDEKQYSPDKMVRKVPHGADKAYNEFKKLFK